LIVNLWLLAWVFFANSGSRDDISPIARRHTGVDGAAATAARKRGNSVGSAIVGS
jgi:hypothetical protein